MELIEIKDSAEEIAGWDEFVLSSEFGHIYQTFDWGEICRIDGWLPFRYMVKEAGRIKAVAQILKRKKGPFSLFYIPRGPIFLDRASFIFLSQQIRGMVAKERAVTCRINPAIKEPSEILNWYNDAGFRKSERRELHVCTFVRGLNKNIEEVWKELSSNLRDNFKKAKRAGVLVKSDEDREFFEYFYEVYSFACRQRSLPCKEYAFFEELWKTLHSKKRMRIFVAFYKDKPVAATLVLLFGNKAEQVWSGVIRQKPSVKSSQLLYWHILEWLKENDYTEFNLGGVPPDKEALQGIYQHKKSLGGDFVSFLGEYDLFINSFLYSLWNSLGRLYCKRNNLIRNLFKK
ncbi:MAG: peptidoglycan bridge formation glycyltransferase FemA/FemB family protein [Candidatus Omnitrophica bacterium]|nr:peptidoglycan bridge formation glycyltransferase FemA/FemB family protein [Candidatus Omnitrophota bacterium]